MPDWEARYKKLEEAVIELCSAGYWVLPFGSYTMEEQVQFWRNLQGALKDER